jgi:hypothetical protein
MTEIAERYSRRGTWRDGALLKFQARLENEAFGNDIAI